MTRSSSARARRVSHITITREFADQYELGQLLGSGGMGAVFAATKRSTGRPVAVKFLVELGDAEIVARFVREARILAQISHRNVVRVIDFGEFGRHLYLVTDLLEGGTLKERLRDVRTLPVPEAVRIAVSTLSGLQACHDVGVIHRDVKPANILFDGQDTPLVADLGIAKLEEASEKLTQSGEVMGTPQYVAPEQLRGQPVSVATDVYAMGLVTYEMVSGANPFSAPTVAEAFARQLGQTAPPLAGRVPGVTEDLDAALLRAMSKRPEERFPTAAEFARALQAAGDASSRARRRASTKVRTREAEPAREGGPRRTGNAAALPDDAGTPTIPRPSRSRTLVRRSVLAALGAAVLTATIVVLAQRALVTPDPLPVPRPGPTTTGTVRPVSDDGIDQARELRQKIARLASEIDAATERMRHMELGKRRPALSDTVVSDATQLLRKIAALPPEQRRTLWGFEGDSPGLFELLRCVAETRFHTYLSGCPFPVDELVTRLADPEPVNPWAVTARALLTMMLVEPLPANRLSESKARRIESRTRTFVDFFLALYLAGSPGGAGGAAIAECGAAQAPHRRHWGADSDLEAEPVEWDWWRCFSFHEIADTARQGRAPAVLQAILEVDLARCHSSVDAYDAAVAYIRSADATLKSLRRRALTETLSRRLKDVFDVPVLGGPPDRKPAPRLSTGLGPASAGPAARILDLERMSADEAGLDRCVGSGSFSTTLRDLAGRIAGAAAPDAGVTPQVLDAVGSWLGSIRVRYSREPDYWLGFAIWSGARGPDRTERTVRLAALKGLDACRHRAPVPASGAGLSDAERARIEFELLETLVTRPPAAWTGRAAGPSVTAPVSCLSFQQALFAQALVRRLERWSRQSGPVAQVATPGRLARALAFEAMYLAASQRVDELPAIATNATTAAGRAIDLWRRAGAGQAELAEAERILAGATTSGTR